MELGGNEPFISYFKRFVFITYVNKRPYNSVLYKQYRLRLRHIKPSTLTSSVKVVGYFENGTEKGWQTLKKKCFLNNQQDKKWLNSTAIERWEVFYNYRRTIFFSFCVSHFAFSLVTSLGNILVIRALFTALSTPANIEKLFLSLAFSDLAVGLVSQLMTGIIYAVILKIVSKGDYNLTSLCPTVLNLYYYLFFSLRRIFSNCHCYCIR